MIQMFIDYKERSYEDEGGREYYSGMSQIFSITEEDQRKIGKVVRESDRGRGIETRGLRPPAKEKETCCDSVPYVG